MTFYSFYTKSKAEEYLFILVILNILELSFYRSFLVHMNIMKHLYFFELLTVRLEVIRSCLKDILGYQIKYSSCFMINELVKKKHTKKYSPYNQIMILKEIYYRCWLIQDYILQLSGFFLLIYFIGYIGQLMYVMFYYVKISILNEELYENLLAIILYFILLNIFTISFFIVSTKIRTKGLKISGLIHQIAQNSINDSQLVEVVKLFSAQISQQPMNYINILGIIYYDNSNINGVSGTE
ncbi:hypothetical protein ACKWTF_008342 [Chironomus riparius]